MTEEKRVCIKTVEMHTGGGPLRIIVSGDGLTGVDPMGNACRGYPPIHGASILDKRRYVRDNLDHLRTMLMWEPRGHENMYGALLVEPDIPEADMAVLFMHNEGYSTMCGHAVISLGRYAIDYKLVKPVSPETQVKIQCPCGLITAHVQYDSETGKTGSVRFESVPGFAFAVDQTISVKGFGEVKYDIGCGGTFYALVDIHQLEMDFKNTPSHQLSEAADSISQAVRSEVKLTYPGCPDLEFLYGTILTDGRDEITCTSTTSLCIFADREVDRSSCGSGIIARTAVQYHKGQTKLGHKKTFVSGKVGSIMTGMPIRVVPFGGYSDAVVVEVSGHGHYNGEATFCMEEEDPLAKGFLIK